MNVEGSHLGGFTLNRRLKVRGETEVWRATRDVDGIEVALKTAPFGSVDADRLRHEAEALSRVVSRLTVACSGFLESDGHVVLALDWCRGGTLKARLASDGPFSVYAVRDMAWNLLLALRDVHAAGLVHRDLKPGNVFLTESGEARLGDFGIALLPGVGGKRGGIVGSAAYMSPEQALGGRLDARSDLYSLGLVLHELATGRQVFGGVDFAAKLYRAQTEEVPLLSSVAPDVPVSFSRFVASLTLRDRALRPASAVEALLTLKSIV